jgi:serine/threonine protein kinase
MPGLYLQGVNAPAEIRDQLILMSKNIEFTREDVKAGNGMVFFGVNKVLGREIAVKFYYWGGVKDYHAEPMQLSTIRAPNVLEILDAGLLDDEWAYFQTPTCPHGDLDDVLERISVGNLAAMDFTAQILTGLSHLHAQNYVHRDLKPANVYVGDDHNAVIGDFGSVQKIPDGATSVPAYGHSLLYRPPEAFGTDKAYGITGDIYQAGMIMFQLLGGYLPYEDLAYLTVKQRADLKAIKDPADQCFFVDKCIGELICTGRILDYNKMPPWVSGDLKKLIKKACHLNPNKRFQTTAAFLAKLRELRPSVLDWRVEDGDPVLTGPISYRIVDKGGQYGIQKRKHGDWRSDNSFGEHTLDQLVTAVSSFVTGK